MTAIRTNYMRMHLARQLVESLSEAESNSYYMFLGKVSEWSTEPVAEVPFSTFNQDDRVHWSDMIGGERIPTNSVTHAIRRHDWESGTVYDQYDDQDTALFTKAFYVLTDESNVYKVIDNNGGAASTVKPTGTGTAIINTADGYRWKYLYSIDVVEATTFLLPSWMPVKFLDADDGSNQWDVQQAAVRGAIDRIEVTDGGTGYTSAPTVTITGDGTGLTATAVVASGEVTEINVDTRGSDYTYATITLSGGGGTGAEARVVFPPAGGHGFNPVVELGGFYVMFTTKFEQDETGTLPTDNDFRKIGIVKDPFDFGTEDITTVSNYNQTTRIELEVGFTGTFNVDEELTGNTSGARATVVRWDDSNRILHVNEKADNVFQVGEVVQTSSGSGTIAAGGITNPDLQPSSGEIVYIDQRATVTRAIDQTETVKVIFEL